jgi:hypothetical protein
LSPCSQATEDREFLDEYLPTMDKEFRYWMANRTTEVQVDGKKYLLAHYDVEVDGPRPGADVINKPPLHSLEAHSNFAPRL